MKKKMRPLLFLIISTIILVSCSESRSIFPRPQPQQLSFKIHTTKNEGTCAFTVSIRTSCSSTRYTRDRISLSFGDAYGNQVYAPRLDDPSSKTFERCSTDTFQINGPCTYQICHLYLYRSGYGGWMPYDVTVYGYNTQPVTFYYNVMIPSNIWYGFNHCQRILAAT